VPRNVYEKSQTVMTTTDNVSLRPFSAAHILALIEGADRFSASFGVPAATGLRDFFVSADVSPEFEAMLRADAGEEPWSWGFAAVLEQVGLVVGTAGFKGPPMLDGIVEIAYAVVPDYQGRGLATQMAGNLVSLAMQDERVRLVRAHTLPTNNASTRVLAKNGFTHIGEFVDADDGLVWRWELPKAG
jgi:RimJ/RimL family protein N-acetyltransferase